MLCLKTHPFDKSFLGHKCVARNVARDPPPPFWTLVHGQKCGV